MKPAVWKKPKKNHSNCFICILAEQIKDISTNYQRHPDRIIYLDESSSCIPPVLNIVREEESVNLNDEHDLNSFSEFDDSDYEYEEKEDKIKPKKLTQEDVNSIVKVLSLSKDNAELVCSFLKSLGVLDINVRITFYRNRTEINYN